MLSCPVTVMRSYLSQLFALLNVRGLYLPRHCHVVQCLPRDHDTLLPSDFRLGYDLLWPTECEWT